MMDERKRPKKLRLFRVNNNGAAQGEPVFETDDQSQLKAHFRRAGGRYRLMVNGKMLSASETLVWMG